MALEDKTVIWRIQAPSFMTDRDAAMWALDVIRGEFTDALVFEVDGKEIDLTVTEEE